MQRPLRQAAKTAKNLLWGTVKINESSSESDSEIVADTDEDFNDDLNNNTLQPEAIYESREVSVDSENSEDSEVSEDSEDGSNDLSDEDSENVGNPELRDKYGNVWSLLPSANSQTPGLNVMSRGGGPTTEAKRRIGDCVDSFLLFLTEEMIAIIVSSTNTEGARAIKDWKVTNAQEMKSYLGIMILLGVYKSNNESIDSMWDAEFGRPVFRNTMSKRRFKQLTRVIRFDDRTTRLVRRQNDKFSAIRNLFTKFQTQLPKYFRPYDCVTIDEQLLAFRGRCCFRQYMPRKPARYGIKFFIMCCSSTSFAISIIPYLGKEGNTVEKNLAMKTVCELVKPIEGSGRNVTTDNYYTSLECIRAMKQRKLSMVGTVRKNRREIPPKALDIQRSEGQCSFFYRKECTLASYMPKKKKIVLLMSSQHLKKAVHEEDHKPEIVEYYNSTKGGVDCLDYMLCQYSVKRYTRRWPMVVFANIIDIAALNAYVLFIGCFPEWNRNKTHKRRLFLHELGISLIQCAQYAYPSSLLSPATSSQIGANNKRSRCMYCERSADRKCTTRCGVCGVYICKEHMRCKSCCK